MLSRLQQVPSELRQEVLRRRALAEAREAFRLAGVRLASEEASPGEPLRAWRDEIRRALETSASIAEERRLVGEARARDLSQVAWWIHPAVALRAFASHVVLQHRRFRAMRALDSAYEALGRAAAHGPHTLADPPGAERARDWGAQAGREVLRFTAAMWHQLRSFLFPKAPALAGMAVGWWIANTYTDSRVRSVLRSVGIGSGGTHLVSGSTYRAMTFWAPLFAAALCAYAGERIWDRLVGRED